MRYEELDDLQLDAIKEVANIGAAHAATALSKLLDRRVDMSTPRANLLPMAEVVTAIADNEEDLVVGVFSTTTGDATVDLLVVFDENSILELVKILTTNKFMTTILQLSDFEKSMCQEVGSILLLHYIRAINTFMNLNLRPSAPSVAIDMVNAVLQPVLAKHAADNEYALTIEVDIFTDESRLKGDFILLPDAKAMDALMVALFGDDWNDEE